MTEQFIMTAIGGGIKQIYRSNSVLNYFYFYKLTEIIFALDFITMILKQNKLI